MERVYISKYENYVLLSPKAAIFGTESEFLWGRNSPLNEENLKQAMEWSANKISASTFIYLDCLPIAYGGTNGCEVIMKAIQQMGLIDVANKMILVLTDGEFTDVSNWDKLKEKIIQNGDIKIHTVAIESE